MTDSRLIKISKDMAAAAGDFEKAIREAAAAAVETLSSIDWKSLREALAAGECEVPDVDPDENPVRPIGIQKGRWVHRRRIR